MKVVIATGLYPPEIGGPATYAATLEAELPKQGIEVAVLPFSTVRKYPKVIRHMVYGWKLWRMSKAADIIYSLDPISVGVPALTVSKIRNCIFVVRLGGDYAWEQGRGRFGVTDTLDEFLDNKQTWPWPVKIFAKVQTFVVSRARRVIAPSKYLKSVIERWGISPEKIQVIYSALLPLEVNETRDVLRSQLEYTDPTIVSAARLVLWKGIDTLILVTAELVDLYPNITLIIVGEGPEEAALKNLVKQLGMEQRVRFTGRLSREDLGAVKKAADVFVLNTGYEGLSHDLIEVMDLGTPIVTTNVGGNPELITDGVSGYLVPFNDEEALLQAITRVIDHPESRERLVQAARLRTKEFSKEKMIDEISNLLRTTYDKSRKT